MNASTANIQSAYALAKERYAALGVETDAAMKALEKVAISLHCWQGDDVGGFENPNGKLTGGIATTGNYPGKARTADEIRKDLGVVYSLLPGSHRLNLHAIYLESDAKVERNAIEPKHFSGWVDWAKAGVHGLDFNPTCFSHPLAADGFTLSHRDPAIRQFWVEHCIASRKIGDYFGKELGTQAVTNIWIPDGYKDSPADRSTPRRLLLESLDKILAEKLPHNLDAVEPKLFGIGSESYVTGSMEFYTAYAVSRKVLLTLDAGHFHPTETIADKISSILLYLDNILLHVSRGVRWDSDHVVTFTDDLQAITQEIVRAEALDRVHIGLDYFDASINRVAAWAIGARNTLRALLNALLEPRQMLNQYEAEGDFSSRLALLEELKAMPTSAVWDYYCQQKGVPSVTTKSPLTGTVLDANSGGCWGMQFKKTGYDALIVRGKAEKPVWIEIKDSAVTFHDATELWGMRVFALTEKLEQNNNKRNVLCIGPAGENLSRIAAIMNDRERAAARGGPGAVMGSKNLKAIVVEGSTRPEVADKERYKFLMYETKKLLAASPLTSQALPEFGTVVLMNIMNNIGALATRNHQQTQFEGAEAISGEELTEKYLVKNAACWACPIGCTRVSKADKIEAEGPEFESTWAFGAQCGVDDLPAIIEVNSLCNDLGMDTISAGSTIACAMELSEKGYLDSDLRFGRAGQLAPTVEAMAYRQDIGAELGDGSLRLATKYGHPELSMTSKGLEFPAYDPRGLQGQGLLYATSNRGGCHMRGNTIGLEVLGLPKLIDRFQVQGKSAFVILNQNANAAIDSLVICKFTNMGVADEYFARVLSAVTGIQYDTGDMIKAGERIWNLERLYNNREGFTTAHDTLPPRLLTEAPTDGPSKPQPCLYPFAASPRWPWPGTGFTASARASCRFLCQFSSATAGFRGRFIPSAAGQSRDPCRLSPPVSGIGGMRAPSKGRITNDDQSRYECPSGYR